MAQAVASMMIAAILFIFFVSFNFCRKWIRTVDLNARLTGGALSLKKLFEAPSKKLSVVIPAQNEQYKLLQTLEETLQYLSTRELKQADFTWELLVMDYGSTDATVQCCQQFVRKFSSDQVRVVRLARQLGKGGAVREGMLMARGELLLMSSADGGSHIADLEHLESKLPERLQMLRPQRLRGTRCGVPTDLGVVVGTCTPAVRRQSWWLQRVMRHGLWKSLFLEEIPPRWYEDNSSGCLSSAVSSQQPLPPHYEGYTADRMRSMQFPEETLPGWQGMPSEWQGLPPGWQEGHTAAQMRNAGDHHELPAGYEENQDLAQYPVLSSGRSAVTMMQRRTTTANLVPGGPVTSMFPSGCRFNLYTREAARILFANQRILGAGFEVELLYLAMRFSIPVAEAQVSWTRMPGVEGRMNSFRKVLELSRIMIGHRSGMWSSHQ